MSGIAGIFHQDGALVAAEDLRRMTSLLARRGPEGVGVWRGGSSGLVPVSYTHLDVYKRQGRKLDVAASAIGECRAVVAEVAGRAVN